MKKKKKTKRLKKKPQKTKRVKRIKKSPFNIIIRDWTDPLIEHKEMQLNENSKLEIHIDGCLYGVSINKKNRCLQFDTHETHLYLQPISVHQFLVKANSKK